MVEHQLPKLRTWVRFPSPAPSISDTDMPICKILLCINEIEPGLFMERGLLKTIPGFPPAGALRATKFDPVEFVDITYDL